MAIAIAPLVYEYRLARERFLQLVERLGWGKTTFPESGANDAGLATDVAESSDDSNAPLLIVSSGLHGVEGPFGSAVQASILQYWLDHGGAPLGCRYLFLHALNPYGFANFRRFDRDNIDPNRNFLLAGERYEGVPPGYADLDRLLNPKSAPCREWFLGKALISISRHGMSAVQNAVATGQYEFPQGLFFGGKSPSGIQRIMARQWPGWLRRASIVVHLDFHTGLGRFGHGLMLGDHPLTSEQSERARRWFGYNRVVPSDAANALYRARGGFGQWCAANSVGRDYMYFCAEFGTYGPIKVLSALRDENRAYHWGDDNQKRNMACDLRDVFGPHSAAWQSQSISEGTKFVNVAAEGLAAMLRKQN